MEDKDKVLIKRVLTSISTDKPASFILEDKKDCDVTFVFYLKKDEAASGSLVRMQLKSESEMHVFLINLKDDKVARSKGPMYVGSYQVDKALLMEIAVFPKQEGKRMLEVKLYSKDGIE